MLIPIPTGIRGITLAEIRDRGLNGYDDDTISFFVDVALGTRPDAPIKDALEAWNRLTAVLNNLLHERGPVVIETTDGPMEFRDLDHVAEYYFDVFDEAGGRGVGKMMTLKEISDALTDKDFVAGLIGDYAGEYSLGVSRTLADEYQIRLHVEGADVARFPARVVVGGVTIPVVVVPDFVVPSLE